MANGTVLVVEDEKNIASLVELYLSREGFTVEIAGDGESALALAERVKPSLVVLDVMLPGIDGIEVCRRLRAAGDVPIIMLTAKDEEVDRVLGLELGADDYVTKPFSPRELVARAKAVLRRVVPAPALAEEESQIVEAGPVRIDAGRRVVAIGDETVVLTAKEFDLLSFLAQNPAIVFSRDRLLERVWGYERPVDTRTVDSHVKSLRKKLGAAGGIVATVRGVGYKVDPGDA